MCVFLSIIKEYEYIWKTLKPGLVAQWMTLILVGLSRWNITIKPRKVKHELLLQPICMCVCGWDVKVVVKIEQQHVVIKKGSEAEQKLLLCPKIGAGISVLTTEAEWCLVTHVSLNVWAQFGFLCLHVSVFIHMFVRMCAPRQSRKIA